MDCSVCHLCFQPKLRLNYPHIPGSRGSCQPGSPRQSQVEKAPEERPKRPAEDRIKKPSKTHLFGSQLHHLLAPACTGCNGVLTIELPSSERTDPLPRRF